MPVSAAGYQISGVHVALAVGGVVLAYAGLKGTNPLAALRDITSGKPAGVPAATAGLAVAPTDASVAGGVGAAITGAAGVAGGNALVAAANKHRGERYSQALRWQPGYSDCSSFVGKSFRDIGITPPGPSLAISYLTWPKLGRVERTQLAPGDLCVNTGHIIIATGRDSAIGQENARDNVQTGTPENLMWGSGSFVCLRYKWGG